MLHIMIMCMGFIIVKLFLGANIEFFPHFSAHRELKNA